MKKLKKFMTSKKSCGLHKEIIYYENNFIHRLLDKYELTIDIKIPIRKKLEKKGAA